jgi:hypothetical protein
MKHCEKMSEEKIKDDGKDKIKMVEYVISKMMSLFL